MFKQKSIVLAEEKKPGLKKVKQLVIEESKLIEACKQGNRKAQELIYQKFSPSMYSIALRYVVGSADAQDVIIQGFTKAFSSIQQFKNDGQFSGWLRKIVVNQALMHLRKKKVDFSISESLLKKVPLSNSYIEDQISADELIQIIQSLPSGYRTVFNLYAIEGYSHKEIAEKLGISEGTSKSQLSKARKVLQNVITKKERS